MVERPNPDEIPLHAWYPAAEAAHVKADQPFATMLHGKPLVLFRNDAGVVGALDDRCAHRGVPLSLGRVQNGTLECAYHGWCFNKDGACVRVPGLQDDAAHSGRGVRAYPTVEQDELIWVWTGERPPNEGPAPLPPRPKGYQVVRRRVEADAGVHAVLENALDVPHTAFLHRGLFRGGEPKDIKVRVVTAHDRVEAHFQDEPVPSGLLGKIIAPGGGVVTHVDRFILPSRLQVEYKLGAHNHILVTGVVAPIHATKSALYAHILFRSRLPDRILAKALLPLGLRIFQQDADILAAQTKTSKIFGEERFVSTELDLLGGRILRLLRAAARDKLHTLDIEDERHIRMRV